jgi:hypothetical protein
MTVKDEFLESAPAVHHSHNRETIDMNQVLKSYIGVKDEPSKFKVVIFENTGI